MTNQLITHQDVIDVNWRNNIVISGYRYNRIPGITILEKNNHNYRYIGALKGDTFLRINPDIEVWWENDKVGSGEVNILETR